MNSEANRNYTSVRLLLCCICLFVTSSLALGRSGRVKASVPTQEAASQSAKDSVDSANKKSLISTPSKPATTTKALRTPPNLTANPISTYGRISMNKDVNNKVIASPPTPSDLQSRRVWSLTRNIAFGSGIYDETTKRPLFDSAMKMSEEKFETDFEKSKTTLRLSFSSGERLNGSGPISTRDSRNVVRFSRFQSAVSTKLTQKVRIGASVESKFFHSGSIITIGKELNYEQYFMRNNLKVQVFANANYLFPIWNYGIQPSRGFSESLGVRYSIQTLAEEGFLSKLGLEGDAGITFNQKAILPGKSSFANVQVFIPVRIGQRIKLGPNFSFHNNVFRRGLGQPQQVNPSSLLNTNNRLYFGLTVVMGPFPTHR